MLAYYRVEASQNQPTRERLEVPKSNRLSRFDSLRTATAIVEQKTLASHNNAYRDIGELDYTHPQKNRW